MKTTKIFSIDTELAKLLESEANKSLLVNNLLKEHYDKVANPYKGMSKEQLDFEIAKHELLLETQNKINKMEEEMKIAANI